MAEVGKGVDSAVLWRFLTVTALHKSAYLLTHLLSLHKGVTNASAYQPIGRYRRSKHRKSTTSLKLHCESQKTRHLTLAHNFTKYLPIFKILSLLDSVGHLL